MIILSTSIATQERVQLDFLIPGTSWEGLFDRLEVYRSRSTNLGPYEALHDTKASPARLPKNGPDPAGFFTGPSVPLNGKTLELLVDENLPLTITFAGTDPFTFDEAAIQIDAQAQGLVGAYVVGAVLVVQTIAVGLKTVLRVVGGEAAPLLGFSNTEPDSLSFGRDSRIVMRHGVEDYSLIDPNGLASFFYKARFFNSMTFLVSDFSSIFQGRAVGGLDVAALCRCYVDLVDIRGNPIANQEVLLYNQFNGTVVDNKTVTGGSLTLLTDQQGHAEALIPRGVSLTVALAGTSLVRDIVVPTDPAIQSLNLLGVTGTNDVFTVSIPNIEYAVRRTL